MKTEQLSLIEMTPKDNSERNAKLRWENGFQRWSGKQANECDYCGVSAVCSCRDNIDKLIEEVEKQ